MATRMLRQYAHWLISHAWLALLLSVSLAVLAASGLQFFLSDPDYRVYFAPDNPELTAFERMEANYARNDNGIFVITPGDGEVFTRETLAAIEWLTDEMELLPMSGRIDSLTNFRNAQGTIDEYGEEGIDSPSLVEAAATLSDAELSTLRTFALDEPQLKYSLISEDARVTAIHVVFNLPDFDPVTRMAEVRRPVAGDEGNSSAIVLLDRKTVISDIVSASRALRDRAEARYPNLTIQLNGILFLNNAFSESSEQDQRNLIPFALLLTFVMLAVFLRSPSGVLGTFLVMILSIASGMGVAFWSGMVLNSVTSMTPVIIMSLSIAHCVHLMVTLQSGMRAGRSRNEALAEAMRVNQLPIFLTSITTAIGLLTLNFSESPPFRDLGNIIAIGVMASWFFSITFFPAFLALMPARWSRGFAQPKAGQLTWIQRGMAWLAEVVIAWRWPLLVVSSLVAAVLVWAISENELDDTYVHYFAEGTEFRDASDYVDANLGGVLPWNIEVCSKIPATVKRQVEDAGETLSCNQHAGSYNIADPAYLQDVEKLANYLREQEEISYVNSFSDVMKRLNRVLQPEVEDNYRLPESRELASGYLFLYEMSLPPKFDLNNQVNMNKSGTRLAFSVHTTSSQTQIELAERIVNWSQQNLSHVEPIVPVGSPLMFAKIGERNIQAMLIGTAVALLLISLLLVVVLRSLRIGLVSIIPNILPVAMAFGVWGLLVSEVGLALSIVASMTLGIVVDDTVHLLSKYLRARREQGLSPEDAVRYAFSTVGSALWVTSLALVAGFIIVAQAGYLPIAQMGWMTALTIMIALIADFLLLPPLLLVLGGGKQHDTTDK